MTYSKLETHWGTKSEFVKLYEDIPIKLSGIDKEYQKSKNYKRNITRSVITIIFLKTSLKDIILAPFNS